MVDVTHYTYRKFEASIRDEHDPTMLVLKVHLFAENVFENLIALKLPRGDRLVDKGNLSFHQKLTLIDALDIIPDDVISSLRFLNKLRNQFAHDLDAKITHNELVKLGSPLGKIFTKYRIESNGEDGKLLKGILHYLCGVVSGACFVYEKQDSAELLGQA
ncbi:hypothetical protein ACPDZV_003444 [Vibrio cholerae]|uniref:hypothetical protein n=1 Tax=Vibrio TaxID=662 RepID=UPI0011DA5163|nr:MULTISPECIES: hypothetical protein [Vibrio]EJN6829803.1 hypothetical protein [Vibrio cidicii]EGQ7673853.1 hypothetical protein [Vibrio cholerae]EGR2424328.1 hypothetical protein [Vibrio cholerae]EJL6659322.1 hypothetical protein [Vibrio cholerae]EKF9385560.1 hypothetical protein [Vibrio cholerae]